MAPLAFTAPAPHLALLTSALSHVRASCPIPLSVVLAHTGREERGGGGSGAGLAADGAGVSTHGVAQPAAPPCSPLLQLPAALAPHGLEVGRWVVLSGSPTLLWAPAGPAQGLHSYLLVDGHQPLLQWAPTATAGAKAAAAGGTQKCSIPCSPRSTHAGEEALRHSGVAYTIIRPDFITARPAQPTTLLVEQGDVNSDWQSTSVADLAAVCVAALTDPAAQNITLELFSKQQPSSGAAGTAAPQPQPLDEQVQQAFRGLRPDAVAAAGRPPG